MSSETRRVYLSDDYYRGALFDTVEQSWWPAEDVFDVPAEQVARWEEAEQAWADAQSEISGLVKARVNGRRQAEEERKLRDDARRAEIRAGLYGRRR